MLGIQNFDVEKITNSTMRKICLKIIAESSTIFKDGVN